MLKAQIQSEFEYWLAAGSYQIFIKPSLSFLHMTLVLYYWLGSGSEEGDH